MIKIYSPEQIVKIREAAQLVSRTHGMLAKEIKEGVTTLYLDSLAEQFIRENGGVPNFKGLYGFPNTLCVSPNAHVVHGIPNKTPLKSGDVVSIDCGALLEGYNGDQAFTYEVGEVDPRVKKLLEVTRKSLYKGIRMANVGNTVGDIGHEIQRYCEDFGYGVVRELCGHGLGKKVHEDPQVPNYGRRGSGPQLKNGMVLAIEPMINLGTHRIKQPDEWTIITHDGKVSAHFEHDIAIVEGRAEILSTYDFIYEALGVSEDK